jgi:hypothetical protein
VSGAVNNCHYFDTSDGTAQLSAVQQSLYTFSDAIFSAAPSDIDYFLGKKRDIPQTVIEKCGSLMPCLHGSDAHSCEHIFEPDNKKYCWIKADPTFNGLRQVIYEPEERVRIFPISHLKNRKGNHHEILSPSGPAHRQERKWLLHVGGAEARI